MTAIGTGLAAIADYTVQALENYYVDNMSFIDATRVENIDWGQTGGAAAGGGFSTGLMLIAGPAVPSLVSLTGLKGGIATTATIATTALAGGGANVSGDFLGRVVQSSLGSEPTSIWDPSTYASSLRYGMLTSGMASSYDELFAKPITSSALAQARNAYSREVSRDAVVRLWDMRLENNGVIPPGMSGFELQMNFYLGAPTEQLSKVSSPLTNTLNASSRGISIALNSTVWQVGGGFMNRHLVE